MKITKPGIISSAGPQEKGTLEQDNILKPLLTESTNEVQAVESDHTRLVMVYVAQAHKG